MENGLFIWNLISKAYLLIFLIITFGCQKSVKEEITQIEINQNELKSGFLICRLGNGFFSKYFQKYASKEQKYSHIGILSKEGESFYVYHSEASELTGIGFVKKEELKYFLQDIKVFDFFEFSYPDSTINEVLDNVKKYYLNKTPFDVDFDSFNDNKLYCAELIAISVNNANDSIQIIPSLSLNGKRLFALDDIYLNENVKPVTLTNIDFKQ